MPSAIEATDRRWSQPVWVLRIGLLIQCLGVASALLFAAMEQESDIYGLLYFDWEWTDDATAQRIEDLGTLLYLACAFTLIQIPLASWLARQSPVGHLGRLPAIAWQTPLLLFVFVWQLLIPITTTLRGGVFMHEWTLGDQAVRYLVPLVLLLLLPLRNEISNVRYRGALFLLQLAAAATFVSHGLKAICVSPQFVTLIVGTFPSAPEETANLALRVIGVQDFLLAALILTTRWRLVAWYMAVWGLITGLSRVTALGWIAYPDVLYRAANVAAPLAIALAWNASDGLKPQEKVHVAP